MSVADNGPAGAGPAGAGTPGRGSAEPSQRAKMLALWSWLMLPGLIVSMSVGFGVGVILMGVMGGHEGELLASGGVWGRLAALLTLLIGVAPTVVGVLLGRKAVRAGAGGFGLAALIVNAVVLVYLVLVQVLQQIMA